MYTLNSALYMPSIGFVPYRRESCMTGSVARLRVIHLLPFSLGPCPGTQKCCIMTITINILPACCTGEMKAPATGIE